MLTSVRKTVGGQFHEFRRVLRVAMVSMSFTRSAGIGLWGCFA